MTERTWTSDELVACHVAADPLGRPDRARIAGSGVEVWALIAYLRAFDTAQTAADYDLPPEAVEAALAYYERHRPVIDARLTLHDAAFADGQ